MFAAFVDLGREHFGEEPRVGLSFSHGDLGQAGGLGADSGQVQSRAAATSVTICALRIRVRCLRLQRPHSVGVERWRSTPTNPFPHASSLPRRCPYVIPGKNS